MEGVATVVKNAGSHFLLSPLPAWEAFPAVLRGKVRLGRSAATNPVAVGDRVRYELEGEATLEHPAVIKEVLKVKSQMDSGKFNPSDGKMQ